jgi:hypothetical protein
MTTQLDSMSGFAISAADDARQTQENADRDDALAARNPKREERLTRAQEAFRKLLKTLTV